MVRDVLRRADGSVAEKTHDWYAPDNRGTVWYFGEATATYDRHGNVLSREGSWKAGVHGAVAGIIMPARPTATDAYRQESTDAMPRTRPGSCNGMRWCPGPRHLAPRGAQLRVVEAGEGRRVAEVLRRGLGIV